MEENEIKIGKQTWTTKNLDVDTYCNGDSITHVEDEEEWANLTTGAWCYYENETENGTTYGKLYNWFAVNDPRGLAPNGYHIPTDNEWRILTNYLGGDSIAGTKMKSTSGWQNNGNGTNSSGFAGLPGGERELYNSEIYDISDYGYWWSSSETDPNSASYLILNIYDGNIGRSNFIKKAGYSVRCIKD